MKRKGDRITSTPFLLFITLALILQANQISFFADGSIQSTNDQNYHIEMKLSHISLSSFIGEGEEDTFRKSISGAGDVNGDGFEDILIGASGNDEGGENAGKAYLILGRSTGWKIDMDLSSSDASFIGETEDDRLGESVSGVGDVNGDGYDDILIGASANKEDWPGTVQAYLFLGRSTGWNLGMNMSNANASFIGASGIPISGAGDVNGDGYDDILFGFEDYDDRRSNVGKTYLVLGRATGWSMNMNLSSSDAMFIGEEAADRSGCSVSGAGDVNGDGYDDILIGAKDYGIGQTYLVLGRAIGWKRDMDLSSGDASFIGEGGGDNSGFSVSGAGDVNGDGYDDILIGAHLNDEEKRSAGQTYLILGRATGWKMDMDLSLSDASFIGEYYGDQSGYSVSGAGDVNADGYDDIIIGARFNDEGRHSAGQTYIVLGRAKGWTMDIRLSCAEVSFMSEAAFDRSGYSVSGAGDVNGDGFDDILIGANGNDESVLYSGKIYLISGYGFPEPHEWNDPDRDGWNDNRDLFPEDPTEWNDTDNDGWGDNRDVFPKDPSEWNDTDNDGWGDNRDVFPEDPFDWNDTDKDGWGDNRDVFPKDPSEWNDTDEDGTGDNSDPFLSEQTDNNNVMLYIIFIISCLFIILLVLTFLKRKGEINKRIKILFLIILILLPLVAIILYETEINNSEDEQYEDKKEVEMIKFEEIGHFDLENIREIEVTDAYVWISCFDWDSDDNGLYRYDPDTHELLYFNESKGLLSNWINCIEVDDEKVWIGTGGGLSLYDQKEDSWSNFTVEIGLGDAEHGYYWVDDIIVEDDYVWVATSGNWQYTMGIRPFGGISCYDKMTRTWTAYGSKNGYLIDDYVQSILMEGDKVFMSTLSGIYIFNTSERATYYWDDWAMDWVKKSDEDNYQTIYSSFTGSRISEMAVSQDYIVIWPEWNDSVEIRSISLNIGTILTQEDRMYDIEIDKDRIYLGTKDGVKIHNMTTDEWTFINITHGVFV